MKRKIKNTILLTMAIGFSAAYAGNYYCIKCDDIGCVRITCPQPQQ